MWHDAALMWHNTAIMYILLPFGFDVTKIENIVMEIWENLMRIKLEFYDNFVMSNWKFSENFIRFCKNSERIF